MIHNRLVDLLQAAVKLELATIPPYLCALYSMHPKATTRRSSERYIVVEEMLHMVLAATSSRDRRPAVHHRRGPCASLSARAT